MACLDSTFLIDFIKETRTQMPGAAIGAFHSLLDRAEPLRTTIVNVVELYHAAESVSSICDSAHIVKSSNLDMKV